MKARLMMTGLGLTAACLMAGQGTQPERPGSTPPRPSQPGQPGQPGQPRPGERPVTPGRDMTARPGQPGMNSERVGQPGEQHKAIDWMEGTWTATATQWRSEGAEPMEFEGMLNSQWVLDGRFLRNEFRSRKEGSAFEGLSFIGYNLATDEYEGSWMDTTSTQMAHSTGHLDETTDTLTMHGEFTDQQTKRKVETRTVAHKESDTRWTWEMFNKPEGGDEFKSLQVVFTQGAGGMDRPTPRPSTPANTPGIRPSDPTRPSTPGTPRPTPTPTPRPSTPPSTPPSPGS